MNNFLSNVNNAQQRKQDRRILVWRHTWRTQPKNNYTKKKTNKLVLFSILRHNLSEFVTQTGLYCSKQLETTFNRFGKKSLHITFNGPSARRRTANDVTITRHNRKKTSNV